LYTFNVPDLRGRFALGVTNDANDAPNERVINVDLGDVGGEEKHTLTEDEMPAHTHDYTRYNVLWGDQGTGTIRWINTSTQVTGATGGDQAHDTVPPYQAVNYIIKY